MARPSNQSKIDELEKQVAFLMDQLKVKENISSQVQERKTEFFEETDEFEEYKISSDDYIKVMSLCPNVLNLATAHPKEKNRKVFRFPEFGSVKKILYRDLLDILETETNFHEQGLFYILSKKVIRSNGFDELYEKILNKEQIEKILYGNQSDAVNLFKSCGEKQRETIVSLILDKMMAGQVFDQNLLFRLAQVIGPEFNFNERFNKMKEVNQK